MPDVYTLFNLCNRPDGGRFHGHLKAGFGKKNSFPKGQDRKNSFNACCRTQGMAGK